MAVNNLTRLREAFRIPESVTITPATYLYDRFTPPKPASTPNFVIDNTVTADPGLYTSALGTIVYADLQFLAGSYESAATPGVIISFGDVLLTAVLITVMQPKKIVKTEIQGGDGTVKEYIGMGDYELTINGVITGGNNTRPTGDILSLKQVIDAPIAIGVASAYLQALGIDQIVIDSCQWGQEEGSYAYQTFSIAAVSDVPQELRITNV